MHTLFFHQNFSSKKILEIFGEMCKWFKNQLQENIKTNIQMCGGCDEDDEWEIGSKKLNTLLIIIAIVQIIIALVLTNVTVFSTNELVYWIGFTIGVLAAPVLLVVLFPNIFSTFICCYNGWGCSSCCNRRSYESIV